MKTGNDVLFQEPTCETRRLRRAVVLEVSKDAFSIRFVADPFEFEIDREVLMYFTGKREFMQQVGRIVEIALPEEGDDEGPVFTIEPVGDAISAESRGTYRVSTISANLEAKVGEEQDLRVQDLSATGFAVVASESYSIGQTLPVSIRHEEEQCEGTASVQSIREFGPRRIRYGMRAIDENPQTSTFVASLQRISLAVQREQLKRGGGSN